MLVPKGVTQLDLIMKDLLDIESEMQFHSQSINDIHQKIALGEKIVSCLVFLSSACLIRC